MPPMNLASPHWYPFEDGATRGMRGMEGGVILEDEQHDDGARITWEGNCARAPHAITLTVYGWAGHVRFFADEATARADYEAMKGALLPVLALLPRYDDDPIDADLIDAALADFMARFP
jgi:hypothetical protein